MDLVVGSLSIELEESKITGIIINDGEVINRVLGEEIKSKRVSCKYNDINPDKMLIGLTVKEELSIPINKYKEETIVKKCNDALKIVGLSSDILNRNVDSLSLSEKKLLSIAINLITNPKVLVLDNPYLYLSDISINKINKILKKMVKRYNKTIVIISNDINLIYNVCDNYIVIDNNKVINKGKKKELANVDNNSDIIKFINDAKKKKNIQLEKTYDIRQLMKDIYRNAR